MIKQTVQITKDAKLERINQNIYTTCLNFNPSR